MSKEPLPHHQLLDQVQLHAIPIVHDLPLIQSLLKWVKHAVEGKSQDHPMGWMLLSDDNWTHESQIEKLTRLNHSVHELGKTIKELYAKVSDYSKEYKKIEKAIQNLQDAFKEISLIEPDIQLLKLGHALFENPDMITHLYNYSSATSNMLIKASHLKQTVFDHVISSLSFSQDSSERIL